MTNSPTQNAINRALDANHNRAMEALRVLEDCLRFGMSDREFSRQAKRLRHDIAGNAPSDDRSNWVICRDSIGDVGRFNETSEEYRRADLESLLAANFQRAQESIRSLEEFTKTTDGEQARRWEQIRYNVYELEHAVMATRAGQRRLHDVHVCTLLTGCNSKDDFESAIVDLIEASVDVIQLRCKQLNDRELIERAERLISLTRPHGIITIINDRADVAAITGADGVHLGQEDIPVRAARRILAPHQIIGVSTHNLEQVRAAVTEGANYLGAGPTFPSKTKTFDDFPGTEFLAKVVEEVSIPVFAIGGITSDNLPSILRSGCNRIAIQSASWENGKVAKTTLRKIRTELVQNRAVTSDVQ